MRSEHSITTGLTEMGFRVDWIRLDENRVQIVVEMFIRIVY